MLPISGKAFVGGLLALILPLLAYSADRNIATAENAQFEVVGLHTRSVSYVEELSQHVVEVAARYLDREALQFPQRILVSLKPEDYVDFEGDYLVRIGERGFVNVDIRWEEPLSLLTTCRALSDALLVRYSIFNYGGNAPETLPKWPAMAIGLQAYISLRPAQSKRLADWLDPATKPTIESLLKRRWDDPSADAYGYALLLAMRESGVVRSGIRSLMEQSIAGVDVTPAMAELIRSDYPAVQIVTLNDWWSISLEELLQPEEELMETMAGSREWIEALADFSDAEIEDLNLKQIWDERENEAVRDLIEARYEILKLRIIRVNPAYFNSARSLGALYETYLLGDQRYKYMHRLAAFLSDFEDAKILEEVVTKALDVR